MACRILICDDNDEDVALLMHALATAQLEMNPVRARDGDEALQLLSNDSSYDLVVMDQHLPRKMGGEVLQFLGDCNRLPSCPVVFFSSQPQLGGPCVSAATMIVEKPFSLDGYLLLGAAIADLYRKAIQLQNTTE